jgi:hypothetical protein
MIPEIPGLSSRYTNQKFGDNSDYVTGRVGQESVQTFTPHEMRKTSKRRKSPY